MVECECIKWKDNIKNLINCLGFATGSNHAYKDGKFKYCPWCGKELTILIKEEKTESIL